MQAVATTPQAVETDTADDGSLPDPSGYGTHDEYFAGRFHQGGRVVYSLDLSVPQLVATLPEPDPDHPQEGNRRITPAHARGFAEYIQERSDWVSPSLLLRAPQGEFKFRLLKEVGGTELGILEVPRLARTSLHILDGQHRILGFHIAWKQIAEAVHKRREELVLAKKHGPAANVKAAETALKKAEKLRATMMNARVSIDIVVVDDPEAYKQVFVDIADNAKGVTRTLSARFDRRKVVNRAMPLVTEHPLLEGRVEIESDRLSATNPNLLSAKNVADIIRTVQVGAARRITRRLEDELDDRQVADHATRFLDVMLEAFPVLMAVAVGDESPQILRRESLLGSATMLRIFAGVYHDLVLSDDPERARLSDDEVTRFFAKFAGNLHIPIDKDGAWRATGLFKESGMAPEASQGDIRKLVSQIVDWADGKEPPQWLT